MCNLRKGVMEKSIEKGLAQDLAKGMEQGMAKGRFSARLEVVQALMDSAQVSADKAMDMLKISGEDRTALKES